ncbi:MAG: NAD(P) transhydrogenase subunit alpha [Pseudomonadota bacterium]
MSEQLNALTEQAADLANSSRVLSDQAAELALNITQYTDVAGHGSFFITGLTVFILACFVGYYVVWRVTPALHSPLMGITNAISSVIIVGALIAAGPSEGPPIAMVFGAIAVTLAAINIFGGFIITRRMLHMFKKKA